MHVRNQPRDEYDEPAGTDTAPVARSTVGEEADAGISWSRDPGDADEPVNGGYPVGAALEPVAPEAAGGPRPEVAGEVPAPEVAGEVPAPEVAGELSPGEVAAPPVPALWVDGDEQRFRDRWRQVQLRFVDDPAAAANDAEALVGEAIDRFTAVLAAHRDELAGWRAGSGGETEELRVVVRRYREFLDRILGR